MGYEELWQKYRPTTLDEVIGQDTAVRMLRSWLEEDKVPHSVMFSGKTGCGKSTMAGILGAQMGARGFDFPHPIDCASTPEPLNSVRELQERAKSYPSANSKCRVWRLEEIHSWTRSLPAQRALLLLLERDSLASVKTYIFLCTTAIEKIEEEVVNRCAVVEVKPIAARHMRTILESVADKEGRQVPDSVYAKIINVAAGSARAAVNQLNSALTGKTEEEMLEAVAGFAEGDKTIDQLFSELFWKRPPSWDRIVKVIEKLRKRTRSDQIEEVRYQILAAAARNLRTKGEKNAPRAAFVIQMFEDSWKECMPAALERCCWETFKGIQDFKW